MNIQPGVSIGNFRIGEILCNNQLFSKLKKIDDNMFQWNDISIKKNDEGIICLISTKNGDYNGISTSKSFRQIIQEGHNLLFDEFDQVFYLKNPKGLCIEKRYENLNLTDLLNSKIQYLTVFTINNNLIDDFIEVNKENIIEIENRTTDFENDLKNTISTFKITQHNTDKKWWKIW